MELPSALGIIPIYIAILGLLFLPFTIRVGLYRIKSKISLGTGDDPELVMRMRGQANFIETVPMALFLLLSMELLGASSIWLHGLASTLVLGRTSHYFGLTNFAPIQFRVAGMVATLLTILLSSVWILLEVLY